MSRFKAYTQPSDTRAWIKKNRRIVTDVSGDCSHCWACTDFGKGYCYCSADEHLLQICRRHEHRFLAPAAQAEFDWSLLGDSRESCREIVADIMQAYYEDDDVAMAAIADRVHSLDLFR